MRTILIAFTIVSLLFLSGCKYPDTVQLQPHVKDDVGGDIAWHPYVKKDYKEFQQWAMGKGGTSGSPDVGPALSAQEE